MAWDILDHVTFTGPAFPTPYVRIDLEKDLNKKKLLPKTTGDEGKNIQVSWDSYRRKLRNLVSQGGSIRIRNHVFEPLVERLGFKSLEKAVDVSTREGLESGGYMLTSLDGGSGLRVWTTEIDDDLDAPARRGRAYRFSPVRIAQRVLLASQEKIGLISNGSELRILICDPARPDSQIEIPIDPYWKKIRKVPDSFRLLLALACPSGIESISDLVEKARLKQTTVTKELRIQARQAVIRFIQNIIDHPENQEKLQKYDDKHELARELWREGLIIIYRILFILKLESSDDPARAFSFASTSLWRNTFSPSIALAPYARIILDRGEETRNLLEDGIRSMFRMFSEGLECTELNVKPLGGALFGEKSTPILSELQWGEHAVAHLLDRLLWTSKKRGSEARERVHYGPLDVEDLGRVYEALLELEPGYSTEPMCRLRRNKLEVVVPVEQGEKYRPAEARSEKGKKTKVEWIEEIPAGRFYLRVGLGRKASGSYYTPHSFVRFLVQETLGPQVEGRSPKEDPNPCEILKLKVLDPAMGSGHFLVEACRYLGDKLYEACRLCDEIAMESEKTSENSRSDEKRVKAQQQAEVYRQRMIDLPDPDDEIIRYLPSRSPEGEESGLSQKKAEALCRRMVAVHCLYGVDKNPLAVEL
ncbi:N-6 DNA methylase, partial [bacterium]|nr:N-6 DNA methylase [bacterium]